MKLLLPIGYSHYLEGRAPSRPPFLLDLRQMCSPVFLMVSVVLAIVQHPAAQFYFWANRPVVQRPVAQIAFFAERVTRS